MKVLKILEATQYNQEKYILKREITIEPGYLAHVPDKSTTATCALDNGTRGLTSSMVLTQRRYDTVTHWETQSMHCNLPFHLCYLSSSYLIKRRHLHKVKLACQRI